MTAIELDRVEERTDFSADIAALGETTLRRVLPVFADREGAHEMSRKPWPLTKELKERGFVIVERTYLEPNYGPISVWRLTRVGKELLAHLSKTKPNDRRSRRPVTP